MTHTCRLHKWTLALVEVEWFNPYASLSSYNSGGRSWQVVKKVPPRGAVRLTRQCDVCRLKHTAELRAEILVKGYETCADVEWA